MKDTECGKGQKCCFNGCQNDCVKPGDCLFYLFNLICAHYHRYFSSCGKNLKSRITIYKEKNVLTLG